MDSAFDSAASVDDLISLSEINEDIIFNQLKQRFANNKIYTLIGDVLIAVNPYKQLDIYSFPSNQSSPPSGSLASAAHVYTIAGHAYSELVSDDTDQCFVISGESGSGKTETCKYIIRYLTELSNGDKGFEQRIMQTNPLLEAFGNAKTIMNNNSSRFGKYLQLKFYGGNMVGAKVNEYLLEKSRVVKQGEGESNFHVFYWILDGLDGPMLDKLHLSGCTQYRYLDRPSTDNQRGNAQMFQQLKECFDLVGFREEEQYSILVCISAILNLGNVNITETDHGFATIDASQPSISIAAELLGIDVDSLIQLITVSVSLTKTETIQKHLSKTKAEAARDAIAKATYDRLFRWVVNQVNRLLAPDINYVHSVTEIGILDIFGFENFKMNSFEQLCINIANEKLHQFFTEHIFQQEMMEYQHEGIRGPQYTVEDNSVLLSAFLSGRGSVFSLLDEQNHVPGATDASFLRKINAALKKEKFYNPPKSLSHGRFSIHHYAGEVTYTVDQFLDKNTDPLPSGAKGILQSGNNQLISLLFRASISSTGTLCVSSATRNKISRTSIHKGRRGGAKPLSSTIGSQFKHSLSSLVSKMSHSRPHFVRCLKPNTDKVPDIFDEVCVKRQIAYTGIAETVRIRKNGFSYRPTFIEFNERFSAGYQWEGTDLDVQCQLTLSDCNISPDQYMLGTRKVFLKHHHLNTLIEHKQIKEKSVIIIQAVVRGYQQKCKYDKLLEDKRKQESLMQLLLEEIEMSGIGPFERLEALEKIDEKRLIEERRRSEFLLLKQKSPPLPPPSDLYELPPTPEFDSDDEETEVKDEVNEIEDQDLFKSLELIHDSASQSKRQSYQWRLLQSSTSVSFSWLHGMLSQKKAEQLLSNQQIGTFLVRVNRKKLTYILTYKSINGFKHINITQLPNMKYLLTGESTAHSSLEDLVCYHGQNEIQSTGDKLTCPFNELSEEESIQVTINDEVFSSV